MASVINNGCDEWGVGVPFKYQKQSAVLNQNCLTLSSPIWIKIGFYEVQKRNTKNTMT